MTNRNGSDGVRKYKQGQYTVELFPDSYINMMDEIHNHHPKLWPIVQGAKDVATQIEEVGVYCEFLIQGRIQVSEICELLLRALQKRRGNILLLS